MKPDRATYIVSIVTAIAVAVFAYTFVRADVVAPTDGAAESGIQAVDASVSADAPQAASQAQTAPASAAAAPAPKPSAPVVIPAADPSRLLIPALGIDANVQQTGITAEGNIGTPTNFTDAAWYAYSSVPGQPGDALIDGHVDNGLSLPGVFKHLSDIKTGDNVYILTHGGKQLKFVVTSVQYYPYESVPSSALLSSSGPSTLKLVTCGGTWVPSGRTYNERLVVTAALVSA